MNDLEPGCLARVIESSMGLNVGAIVTCVKVMGEHEEFGTIWEIWSAKELVTAYGGKGQRAHSPAKWLKKIEPDELDKTSTKELETA